jgi:LysM repeat protein
MWKFTVIGWLTTAALCAQLPPSQLDFANLREDVRGLSQRVGELQLRVEQLERENNELRQRAGSSDRNSVTPAQLSQAVDELNRSVHSAVAASKSETLQQVATQMEKLANQMNVALDAIAKNQAARPVKSAPTAAAASAPVPAPESAGREGTSYTVQKGDTLASIAKKTGAREQDIVSANRISNPSRIAAGQVLIIPNPPPAK